ncbi:hypothetical protein IEQ34_011869 [Dendrobium chrysotoxum]|uniref:type I protein arginine methyltransferase n=1 Tax=Dendrobium chrysotoxum TaxID=161865 RepID=A0AAV7GSH7_DENCH|nr:hypothetical protein IEQ34_011869 [Dendrobium chrysotoxum]
MKPAPYNWDKANIYNDDLCTLFDKNAKYSKLYLAIFWQQQNFFGVDLSPLHGSAFQAYFSQPVVDAFDPRLLVSPATFHTIDFTRIKEEELYEIDIPLHFTASVGGRVHGLACWFDVLFDGSSVQRWLTTAPGAPTTHWYQLRCVLSQPIYVMSGQEITGRFNLVAHSAQSYTINLTLSAKMFGPGADQGGIQQTSSCKLNLKDPYYRMSQTPTYAWNQDLELQEAIDPQEIIQTPEEIDPCIILQTEDCPEAFSAYSTICISVFLSSLPPNLSSLYSSIPLRFIFSKSMERMVEKIKKFWPWFRTAFESVKLCENRLDRKQFFYFYKMFLTMYCHHKIEVPIDNLLIKKSKFYEDNMFT